MTARTTRESSLTLVLRTATAGGVPVPQVESLSGPGLWHDQARGISVAVATSPSGRESAGATAAAQRIGEAYLADPGRWPAASVGTVSAIIVDLHRGQALAGIDDAGVHQFYWTLDGDRLLAGTRIAGVIAGLGQSPILDPQSIYHYVYFHCIPSPRTIFRGIGKLPAGHHLRWVAGGDTSVFRHFDVEFATDAHDDTERLAAELRDLLDASISRAVKHGCREGAFLSGGLDSSTVAGLLARRKAPETVPTFSIGFDAEGYDEIAYARVAAQRFGTDPHEYYVTPDDIFAAVRDIAAAFDEPFGNSSAIPVYFCARLASDAGVQRMLAGDGGDELFAGNARYAKQLVFERYGKVPSAVRRALLEPILLNTSIARMPLARKLASYVRQAQIPLPDRLQTYNYLHRHDPATIFSPRLLEQVDTNEPLSELRAEYGLHPRADAVDRMLFLDWKFTLHDNDLVKVNRMCGLAGVDVAYPMLDEALIRLSCRVPAAIKLRDRQLRWFYKHALREFLPAEIIDKKKHGFGLPFGVWMKDHADLHGLAMDSLASLSTRGLFKAEFVSELLRLHADVHPAYYGEMVWVLLMLELWLQAHAIPAAT